MRGRLRRQVVVGLSVSLMAGLSAMLSSPVTGAVLLGVMLGTVAAVYLFLRGREEGEEP